MSWKGWNNSTWKTDILMYEFVWFSQYACRKTLADSRPRIRGRFIRNKEIEKINPQVEWSHIADGEEDDEMNWISFLDIHSHQLLINPWFLQIFRCNWLVFFFLYNFMQRFKSFCLILKTGVVNMIGSHIIRVTEYWNRTKAYPKNELYINGRQDTVLNIIIWYISGENFQFHKQKFKKLTFIILKRK